MEKVTSDLVFIANVIATLVTGTCQVMMYMYYVRLQQGQAVLSL